MILIIINYKSLSGKYFKLLFPFLLYFLTVVYITFIDFSKSIFNIDLLLRNSIILIIPVFIFLSKPSIKDVNRILLRSTVLISVLGISFLFFWFFGHLNDVNLPELTKDKWFKKELQVIDYETNQREFEISIPLGSTIPSLRTVAMLNDEEVDDEIVREFTLRNKDTIKDSWILLRNINTGNEKAWINIRNGIIGKIEGNPKLEVKRLENGALWILFSNIKGLDTNREWFYLSFVDGNGSYRWDINRAAKIYIKNLEFYSNSGKNYLKDQKLFKTYLRENPLLSNYGHSTYMGLIFLFSLSFLILHSPFNSFIRLGLISIHCLVIISLASKAIFFNLLFLLIYSILVNKTRMFSVVILISLFIITNEFLVGDRILDFLKTLWSSENELNNKDLLELSSANRIEIIVKYFELIVKNPIFGYGFQNGAVLILQKLGVYFNAHNQFLQSLFDGGIIGLFALVNMIFKPIINYKRWKLNTLELVLIFSIIFNSLFESILFRQWGLLYFSFIFALVYNKNRERLKWFP